MLDKSYTLDEFSKISKSDWQEKLIADIGIEKAEQIQNFQLSRGIVSSAYIDRQEVVDSKLISQPDRDQGWLYLQPFSLAQDPDVLNKKILYALNNGAEGLMLSDELEVDFDRILKGVNPEHCLICLSGKGDTTYFEWLKNNGFQQELCRTLSGQHHAIAGPNGAEPITELCFILTSLVDELDNTNDVHEMATSLWIRTSLSSRYFLEVAKIRSLRQLIDAVLHEYDPGLNQIHIHADCMHHDKNNQDESNYLHCTTQAMAAAAGGVDSISIHPNIPQESSTRIARNISNLLREESQFGRVADPGAGSFYIEHLTDQLSRKVWEQFREVQSNGGISWARESKYFENELAQDQEFGRIKAPAK